MGNGDVMNVESPLSEEEEFPANAWLESKLPAWFSQRLSLFVIVLCVLALATLGL